MPNRRAIRNVQAAISMANDLAGAGQYAHTLYKKHFGKKYGPAKRTGFRKSVPYTPSKSMVVPRQLKFRATSAKTARARVAKKKSYGRSTGPGRSGGFLTTAPLAKGTRSRMSKRGIVFTKEVGGVTSSPDMVVIGHITTPIELMKANAWRAIFKYVFLEAGGDIKDTEEILSVANTDELVVQYSNTTGGILANQTRVLIGTESIETLVTWAMGSDKLWNQAQNDQIQFQNIRYIPKTLGIFNVVNVSMAQMKIEFDCKSALKMQNRTVEVPEEGEQDDQADDVNNVPLYGTSYEGNGTGTLYIAKKTVSGNQACFFGHTSKGTILSEPSLDKVFEPPEPSTLDKVSRVGKVKIEPGEIKTSVLTSHHKMFFNDFWQLIAPFTVDASGTLKKPFGRFRMFMVEKMIHYSATDSAIATAYELNLDILTQLSFSRSFQSVRRFEFERDQNL